MRRPVIFPGQPVTADMHVSQACEAIGIPRDTLQQILTYRKIETHKKGRLRMVPADTIRALRAEFEPVELELVVGTSEASRRLGYGGHVEPVHRLIRYGMLEAHRCAGKVYIWREGVEALEREPWRIPNRANGKRSALQAPDAAPAKPTSWAFIPKRGLA